MYVGEGAHLDGQPVITLASCCVTTQVSAVAPSSTFISCRLTCPRQKNGSPKAPHKRRHTGAGAALAKKSHRPNILVFSPTLSELYHILDPATCSKMATKCPNTRRILSPRELSGLFPGMGIRRPQTGQATPVCLPDSGPLTTFGSEALVSGRFVKPSDPRALLPSGLCKLMKPMAPQSSSSKSRPQ